MGFLISRADGNFTDSATWGAAETGTGATQTSVASSTGVTASYVWSPTFTVTNGNVIEGVMVYVSRLVVNVTLTVALSDDNGVTATREVAVSNTDIWDHSIAGTVEAGWVFFKFSSPLTGDGGSDYRIGIKGTGNMSVFRSGTAADWARILRTDTAATPAAGDVTVVIGEITGAGTYNDITVTMDETASTDYGSIVICRRGTLTWGTAASTAYYLKVSGDIQLYQGGTLQIGTTGTPIPSTSTAEILFDCASNGQYGLRATGSCTISIQGTPKATPFSFLTADASATDTIITVASTTGWTAGDVLCFPPTGRTQGQYEAKTISTVDSATQVTLTAGLTYAHSGTLPTRAAVGNLTRNVKLHGISLGLNMVFTVSGSPVVDIDYAEFYYYGAGSNSNLISGTSSSAGVNINGSTFAYNSTNNSTVLTKISTTPLVFTWNVCYSVAQGLSCVSGAAASLTLEDCLFIGQSLNSGNSFVDLLTGGSGLTINRVWVYGGLSSNASVSNFQVSGTIAALNDLTSVCGSNGASAVHINCGSSITMTNIISLNHASGGLTLGGVDFTIDGLVLAGNVTRGLWISNNGVVSLSRISGITLKNFTISSMPSFGQTIGVVFGSGTTAADIYFENGEFGSASNYPAWAGSTTHSTSDIFVQGYCDLHCQNVGMASSTEVNLQGNLLTGRIHSQKHDQTVGNHKTWKQYGTISIDSAIYDSTPSERLTPINASSKLESGSHCVAVNNGGTVTPSVKVRKSVGGDGAAYNGNQPRLIVKKNVAAGISADTVLDTATAASDGAWETLTGTTGAVTDDAVLEFVVDCDGTAGWVNVDTFSSSGQPSTGDMKHWRDGLPYSGTVPAAGGSSGARLVGPSALVSA